MLVQREASDMYFLKVTFSFRSIQEGEQEVEADSKEAAVIATTVRRTLHHLWLYYRLSVFVYAAVSVKCDLYQIIRTKPGIK